MKHSAPTPAESEATVNNGRRRFARAGLAAPAVLGTLSSPPVLATNSTTKPPYHCTISGQLSGSKSRAPDSTDCKTLGRSPGYWKNHDVWPGGLTKGFLPNASCSFTTTAPRGTFFGGYTYNGKVLADKFRRKTTGSGSDASCTVVDALEGAQFTSTTRKATMLQVLETGGGLNDSSLKALGRATVATILNGLQFGLRYPLSPDKAIDMFNVVAGGAKYPVSTGVSWDADQVKTYFESLYGNA